MSDNSASCRQRSWLWGRWIVAVLLIGGGLVPWGVGELRRAGRQRAAAAKVRKLGGWAFYNCKFNERGRLKTSGLTASRWLRKALGTDLLGKVNVVTLAGDDRLDGFLDFGLLQDLGIAVTDDRLELLHGLPDLQWLALSHTELSDQGLQKNVGPLKKLTKLWLNDTLVTDAGLKSLAETSRLEGLWLDDTCVTDAGLQHLERLDGLRILSLKRTQVSDAGLAYLTAMNQLESLRLDGTNCTFSGVMHFLVETQRREFNDALKIAGYVKSDDDGKIVSLDLSITRLSDSGLMLLEQLSELEWLFLNGTQVTDAGLAHLSELKGLTLLHLADTQITDAGVSQLVRLANLRTLHLERTRVTEKGVREFEEAKGGRTRVYWVPTHGGSEDF